MYDASTINLWIELDFLFYFILFFIKYISRYYCIFYLYEAYWVHNGSTRITVLIEQLILKMFSDNYNKTFLDI